MTVSEILFKQSSI